MSNFTFLITLSFWFYVLIEGDPFLALTMIATATHYYRSTHGYKNSSMITQKVSA